VFQIFFEMMVHSVFRSSSTRCCGESFRSLPDQILQEYCYPHYIKRLSISQSAFENMNRVITWPGLSISDFNDL